MSSRRWWPSISASRWTCSNACTSRRPRSRCCRCRRAGARCCCASTTTAPSPPNASGVPAARAGVRPRRRRKGARAGAHAASGRPTRSTHVAESFEFDPVDWVTAGAVGEAGARTFYLQARRGTKFVSFLLEKTQVASLSQLAQQLLARVQITVIPDNLDFAAQSVVEPAVPVWRVGGLSLGMDTDGVRFVLEATELPLVEDLDPVSYTHLRAHETVLDLVCRLLLEKKKKT